MVVEAGVVEAAGVEAVLSLLPPWLPHDEASVAAGVGVTAEALSQLPHEAAD